MESVAREACRGAWSMEKGLRKRVLFAGLVGVALAAALILYKQLSAEKIVVAIDAPYTLRTVFDHSDRAASRLYATENPTSVMTVEPLYYDPKRPRHIFEEARNEGIRFFVTTQPSSTLVPIRDLFATGEFLIINTAATSPLLSGRDDDVLRLIPDGAQEQRQIADYINQLPGKRLLVLQDTQNAGYTDPAFNYFSQRLAQLGKWHITHEKVRIDEADLEQLRRTMAGPYDALYILAGNFNPSIGNLAQLFYQQHPRTPIVLTPWARSPSIYETAGDALQNITLLSHFPGRHDSPAMADYFRRFEQQFGYPPAAITVNVRAGLEVLEQAFAAGHTTPTSVKAYLLKQKELQTSLFPVRFDSNGDSSMTLVPISNLGRELTAIPQ